jgi:hypothetical protein
MRNIFSLPTFLALIIGLGLGYVFFKSKGGGSAPTSTTTTTAPLPEPNPNVYTGGVMVVRKIGSFGGITPKQRTNMVAAYWGIDTTNLSQTDIEIKLNNIERHFPITDKALSNLFKESDGSQKVVIKVTDIDIPASVKASWLPWDANYKGIIKQNDGAYYFELDSALVYRQDPAPNTPPDGIINAAQDSVKIQKYKDAGMPVSTNALSARLAKIKDKYYLIVNSTYIYLLREHSGGGTEPPGSGARIPPGE